MFRLSESPSKLIARNMASRYVAIVVDALLGLLLLPFNLTHLGPAAYGLWVLSASLTVHFAVLDLGFGGAFVRFVARYRARRDADALNEIASTLFHVHAAIGCLAYLAIVALALNLEHVFRITPEQADVGRVLLLVLGVHVALSFPFSIYGGVVNGFQRYNVNAGAAIGSAIAVAIVNVAVLKAGYGLVPLVIGTTSVRVLTYFVYRANAQRIYPGLRIRPSLFRRERLRELLGFSVYSLLIDMGHRLNYQVDAIVIGAFLGATPVAIWAPAARIVTVVNQLTNQLNAVLFPVVVDSDTTARAERLQRILVHGTRLSMAMVLPVGVTLVTLADPVIHVWVGSRVPAMKAAVPVLQILACVAMVRVGAGTATNVLKGAGMHRLMATAAVTTGIVNIVLSILLIGPLGLPGVALATLIPIFCSTWLVIYPSACRRVGLPFRALLTRSILPAVWPAAALAAAYVLAPSDLPRTLPVVALQSVVGGLAYLALFAGVAIDPKDRLMYLSLVGHVFRRPRLTAAV